MSNTAQVLEKLETALSGVRKAMNENGSRPKSVSGYVSPQELKTHEKHLEQMIDIVTREDRESSFSPALSYPVIDHWAYEEELGKKLVEADRAFNAWKEA